MPVLLTISFNVVTRDQNYIWSSNKSAQLLIYNLQKKGEYLIDAVFIKNKIKKKTRQILGTQKDDSNATSVSLLSSLRTGWPTSADSGQYRTILSYLFAPIRRVAGKSLTRDLTARLVRMAEGCEGCFPSACTLQVLCSSDKGTCRIVRFESVSTRCLPTSRDENTLLMPFRSFCRWQHLESINRGRVERRRDQERAGARPHCDAK